MVKQWSFILDNKGQTYYNGAIKGGDDAYDLKYRYKTVTLSKSDSFVSKNPDATQTRGTVMNFLMGGFRYFVGGSSYEIFI
jgi:hypothetical protein